MKLEVLLSVMNIKNYNFINTLNINTDCVIINQCDTNNINECKDKGRNIKFISTTDRGLSKSRNMAIENAEGDICILCDNDVEYLPDYEKTILNEFIKNTKYDVIVFFVKKNRPNSRPYFNKKKRMGYYSTLKVSSFEIAFKRKVIKNSNIRFKVKFGAGAKYSMGEENIFLYECLKKGLNVLYVPKQIASLRDEESTWFKGYNKKYFIDRGAVFHEMSNIFSILFILQFAIRKYNLYKYDMTLKNAIKFMLEGRRNYIKELKNKL